MSISWGTGWFHFSDKGIIFDEEEVEKAYVEHMIASSADKRVRDYYSSTVGGQVYVKAGRHTSDSESRIHITLQLGLSTPPYSNQDWPARTAHVIDLVDINHQFPTDVFLGFTKDSKKKINSS